MTLTSPKTWEGITIADVLAKKVQNSAKMLDREVPGWFHSIDLLLLDMGDAKRCILGQIFGDYCSSRTKLKMRPEDLEAFHSPEDALPHLDDLWRQEIMNRRATA